MHNLVGGAQRCSHHSVLLSNRVLKKQGIESYNSRESSQGTAALRQFSGGKGSPWLMGGVRRERAVIHVGKYSPGGLTYQSRGCLGQATLGARQRLFKSMHETEGGVWVSSPTAQLSPLGTISPPLCCHLVLQVPRQTPSSNFQFPQKKGERESARTTLVLSSYQVTYTEKTTPIGISPLQYHWLVSPFSTKLYLWNSHWHQTRGLPARHRRDQLGFTFFFMSVNLFPITFRSY